jgi:hypothetical protein
MSSGARTTEFRYWPYDEVTASKGERETQFVFRTPWITATIDIDNHQVPAVNEVVEKLSKGGLSPEDLGVVSWVFSSLSEYPLSYVLPRASWGRDVHEVFDRSLLSFSPQESLAHFSKQSTEADAFRTLSKNISTEWKWDLDGVLALSTVGDRFDPLTVLSCSRRFHLLDSVESNKTEQLFEFTNSLAQNDQRFRDASSMIVRQNHYVTQKCEGSLRPALKTSQSADGALLNFIEAERGHDLLLGRSLQDLGVGPEKIPVVDAIRVLMELFRLIGLRNFLAFAMVVDMFERSSYQEHDPLASLLISGGLKEAAKHLDTHKDINDSGGHENIAFGLLDSMAPVSEDYVAEALRLAELTTAVMHLVSKRILEFLQSQAAS